MRAKGALTLMTPGYWQESAVRMDGGWVIWGDWSGAGLAWWTAIKKGQVHLFCACKDVAIVEKSALLPTIRSVRRSVSVDARKGNHQRLQ